MRGQRARGLGPYGAVSWLDLPLEDAERAVAEGVYTLAGMFAVRLVEVLPATVDLVPEGMTTAVPVLPVHEVEAAHPALAELLARWREVGAVAGRTVGR